MGRQPTVMIYTQVYNTRAYLAQCIESVLGQTFSDFEYVLIDNGSTDGCKEMLEQYAAQDGRIRLIRFEENRRAAIWWQVAQETANSRYIANLDSDDWWEPDYLESLIGFSEENHLDLAMTGSVNYYEETGVSQVFRKLDEPVVLSRWEFAKYYPQLWGFPSTNWANIMRTELFQKTAFSEVFSAKLSNGADTASMLRYMEHCRCIGIDHTALYHYRIRPKQLSFQYNPRRFDSNIYLLDKIQSFLRLNYALDGMKREWLKQVHLKSMVITLDSLNEAELSPDEKAAECARIAAHPLTAAALTNRCAEREQWVQRMWTITSKAVQGEGFTDVASMQTVLSTLCPRCRQAVTGGNAALLLREPAPMAALRQDDPDLLARCLLDLIAARDDAGQCGLGKALCALAADRLLLCGIDDERFLREYRAVYWSVWQGNTLDALDEMTGMLLENRVQEAEEDFLQLYLSAAAQLGQAPAFVFGEIRLAKACLREGRTDECRTILDELVEMGVQDDGELADLRRQLEARSDKL